MAHTKQTAHKQLTPGMSMRQIDTSASEEEEEPKLWLGKNQSLKRRRERLTAVELYQKLLHLWQRQQKWPAKKGKEGTATPGTSKQKKTLATKKETSKGAKKKTASQDTREKSKAQKEW